MGPSSIVTAIGLPEPYFAALVNRLVMTVSSARGPRGQGPIPGPRAPPQCLERLYPVENRQVVSGCRKFVLHQQEIVLLVLHHEEPSYRGGGGQPGISGGGVLTAVQ